MVSWWWIPVAAWVGYFVGVLVISLCTICKDYNRKIEGDNKLTKF